MNNWSNFGFGAAPRARQESAYSSGVHIEPPARPWPGDNDGLFLSDHDKAIRSYWPLRSIVLAGPSPFCRSRWVDLRRCLRRSRAAKVQWRIARGSTRSTSEGSGGKVECGSCGSLLFAAIAYSAIAFSLTGPALFGDGSLMPEAFLDADLLYAPRRSSCNAAI